MKLNHFHRCIRAGAIIISPPYLFIAAVHLFFVPPFQQRPTLSRTNTYKKNTQSVYLLVRNDRSTFSESRIIKTLNKKSHHSYPPPAANNELILSTAIHHCGLFKYQADGHDNWLRYGILRI